MKRGMLDPAGAPSQAPAGADLRAPSAAERWRGRAWALAQLDWRPALAGLVLIAVDWLVMCACLCAVWSIRTAVLPAFAPNLGAVLPLRDSFAGMYGLLPWTIAFA